MKPRAWKAYGRYGTVGLELVLSIVVGYLVGHWLDIKLGTGAWLSWIGGIAGVYAGFRALFKAAKQMQHEAEEADRSEDEGQE
jgi:F0F1-type ATP synthase assembly protein I